MKFLIFVFTLNFAVNVFAVTGATSKGTSKLCSESASYDAGFNQGKDGKDLSTPSLKDCSEKQKLKLIEVYRRGYKEGFSLSSKTKSSQRPPTDVVHVVSTSQADPGYLATIAKCSEYKKNKSSCFSSYEGEKRGECEVCKENRSCFMSLSGERAQALCSAYHEKKSCSVAFSAEADRAWCSHLRDGKTCDDAFGFNLSEERTRCEQGEIPREHFFWMN